jgi:hypothetical protein
MSGYEDYERVDDPSKVFEPRKYKIRYRCVRCGHLYHQIASSLQIPDKPCPKKACREAILEEEIMRRAENLAAVLAAKSFPGIVGDKPIVKAIDTTAQVVMEDYGMTDLKDNLRPGDSMAPKLPPEQQKKVDNFFSGGAKKNTQAARRMTALGQRAIAGSFKNAAVTPNEVFRAPPGQPAFRKVN